MPLCVRRSIDSVVRLIYRGITEDLGFNYRVMSKLMIELAKRRPPPQQLFLLKLMRMMMMIMLMMLVMITTTDSRPQHQQQQQPAPKARVSSTSSSSSDIPQMEHVQKNATYSERACKNLGLSTVRN